MSIDNIVGVDWKVLHRIRILQGESVTSFYHLYMCTLVTDSNSNKEASDHFQKLVSEESW